MSSYFPNESYDSYRSVDLEARAASASPYELVLVLMDGLLDELARARGHIEHKRYQQKGASLEKCMNILNGLNGALDEEGGGEVVQGLSRLYEYCIYRLSDVSVTLSLDGLDEVVKVLETLREGWEGVSAARKWRAAPAGTARAPGRRVAQQRLACGPRGRSGDPAMPRTAAARASARRR